MGIKLNTKNLKDVVLGTPLLAETIYTGKIDPASVEIKENKGKDGNVLKFRVVIQDEILQGYQDGKEYDNRAKWAAVFVAVSLVEKNGYDPNTRLKEIGLALGLDPEADIEDSDLKSGVEFRFTLKHKPAKDGYDAGNEIKKFISAEEA